jgi:uncharacterized protein (TIGR02231 family)
MSQLTTTITAVTVYPDRARLARSGTVKLEAGVQFLEIEELPLHMDVNSVRATARGTARARLLGVQTERMYYTAAPAESIRKLEAALEQEQDALKQLEAQVELVKQQRATLTALAGHTQVYATALAAGEMKMDDEMALFDGLRARLAALDGETLALAQQRREVERRLQKLQNDLNQQRNARPRERYMALVEVEVTDPGELTLELNYVVTGAGWKPLYDLRLLEEGASPSLEVGYLAQVSQATGEPWTDVALTLSTARPALAGRLPELQPWYVQQQPVPPPAPAPVMRSAKMAGAPMVLAAAPAPQAADRMAEAAPPPMQAMEEATATVESAGAAVTYQIGGRVSVPGDGSPRKVTVARYPLTPKLDYVCASKLVSAVYRRAKAPNASPYTLLPGAANLFAGGEFIGATQLELTAPQGELELYLGVDDRIKVERELKRRDVDKRFIGGKRRLTFGYEITLENLLDKPARLLLHDQIPAARHEEIKVRLESADPKPSEQSELNLLDWDLTLAPKEKRVVRFDFSVEHPQEMVVIGLP